MNSYNVVKTSTNGRITDSTERTSKKSLFREDPKEETHPVIRIVADLWALTPKAQSALILALTKELPTDLCWRISGCIQACKK